MNLPFVMFDKPAFKQVLPRIRFSSRLVSTWGKALTSDDVNLQRKVAELVPIAIERGVPGLEQLVSPLLDRLVDEASDRRVKVAAAKALVALNQRKKAAEPFLSIAESATNEDLQAIVQPALAKWKVESAKEIWEKRVSSESESLANRIMALEGLAQLDAGDQLQVLIQVANDVSNNYRLRFAASRALGDLEVKGLEESAQALTKSERNGEKLLAIQMLKRHESDSAIELRLKLAQDDDAAISSIAWEHLMTSSRFRELDPLVEWGRKNREPKVRKQVVKLLGKWKTEESCRTLGQMLADQHPTVRNLARSELLNSAENQHLKATVIQSATKELESNWQGRQQAILLLTELSHRPAAVKFVQLLDHDRPEVHVTAAWGLQKLSVGETLLPVLEWTENKVESIKGGKASNYSESNYYTLAHLIQLLGQNKQPELERTIIPKLIPKDISIIEYPIRAAAIWSLGQIYDGKPLSNSYQEQLVERILDEDPMNPEDSDVKALCAYVLGVTQSKETLSTIEKYAELAGSNTRLGYYCWWALNQLDGRPIPEVPKSERLDNDWFLAPIE